MGVLSPEELFISPITSILLLVLVVVFLEYGSRYFQKMQELPNVEWRVLEVFTGELFDVTTRRDHLNPALGLGGVRSLYAQSADANPIIQSRAASAIASLHHLAANGMLDASTAPSDEHIRALATLTNKYTASARGHAALGVAAAALSEGRLPLLLKAGALEGLCSLSLIEDADAQGAAALALALMCRNADVRAAMLEGPNAKGLHAIYSLMRSTNPDAVRCAACALALIALDERSPSTQPQQQLPKSGTGGSHSSHSSNGEDLSRAAIAAKVGRVFAPNVLSMLCRSRDVFLQVHARTSERAASSIAAAAPL